LELLAHRAWSPPSSSLAEEKRLCSLLLRAAARDSRRSQLDWQLLAHLDVQPLAALSVVLSFGQVGRWRITLLG
jgi:hypothetical protein